MSKIPQFIEGPWKADIETDVIEGMRVTISCVSVDADDDGRAQDYGHSLLEDGYLVCENDEVNRANVELMAAAPDLYSALINLRKRLLEAGLWDTTARTALGFVCLNAEMTLAQARGEDYRYAEDDDEWGSDSAQQQLERGPA
jgi:hypothetical protein